MRSLPVGSGKTTGAGNWHGSPAPRALRLSSATGEPISAERALQLGLVNALAERDGLLAAGQALTLGQRRLLGDLGHDFRPGDFFYAPEDQEAVMTGA